MIDVYIICANQTGTRGVRILSYDGVQSQATFAFALPHPSSQGRGTRGLQLTSSFGMQFCMLGTTEVYVGEMSSFG